MQITISSIIFLLLSVAFIVFGIYLEIKHLKIKKHGISTKFKVKACEEDPRYDPNAGATECYRTTFEYNNNSNLDEQSIITLKKFKVGSIVDGVYLNDGNIEKIYITGEGYQKRSGGLYLSYFGLMILIIMILYFLQVTTLVMIMSFLGLAILFVIFAFLSSLGTKANKTKHSIDEEKIQLIQKI